MNRDNKVLNDTELEAITGGIGHFEQVSGNLMGVTPQIVLHNMPQKSSDEKYVLVTAPTAADIISELKS